MKEKTSEIWYNFHDKILGYIISKVKDKAIAEDILQDVFIKIQTKIEDLKDIAKLQSWVFQIARNAVIDHYREKNKLFDMQEYKTTLGSDKENLIMSYAESWIGEHIDVLPEKYKRALIITEIEQQPIKVLAEREGISYTNAKTRVQRARKLLKQDLEDCCTFFVDKYGNILDYQRKSEDCRNC